MAKLSWGLLKDDHSTIVILHVLLFLGMALSCTGVVPYLKEGPVGNG